MNAKMCPVTEVTCISPIKHPLIGSQGAITRDVGEGFPIHNPKAQNGCECIDSAIFKKLSKYIIYIYTNSAHSFFKIINIYTYIYIIYDIYVYTV